MMTLSGQSQYDSLLSQGMLMPIEDLVAEYAPNVYAARTTEWIERLREKDGHIYTLDNYETIGDNQGVLIRKDWLDNLGLELPDTPDELYEVLTAFVNNDPDGNGEDDTVGMYIVGSELNRNYKSLLPAFNSNPEQWIWEDGEIVYGATRVEENAAALEYLNMLYNDGLINATYLTDTLDDRLALLHAGKIGIVPAVSIAYCNPTNIDYCSNGEQWVALNKIVGDEGHFGVLSYSSPETVHAYGAVIPVGSVDPVACMMYINMICTEDMQRKITNGFEGTHWELDENGLISYIGQYKDATMRYAEGFAFSYVTPCMYANYAPYMYTEQIMKDYNEKFALSEDWYAAIMTKPAAISNEQLDAGMSTFIMQTYHDLIMKGGDFEEVLAAMVETLYADYNLAQQEEIYRAYALENGYYK